MAYNNKLKVSFVDIENPMDLLNLYFLMNDEKGMLLRNQHHAYTQKKLEAYLRYHRENNGDLFFLIKSQSDDPIGYYQVTLNRQHLVAHIYFSFLWDIPELNLIFIEAFEVIKGFLKAQFKIQRIVLPITGNHPDVEQLILNHPHITSSITLQQEHLDKCNVRQLVTYYDYFVDSEE